MSKLQRNVAHSVMDLARDLLHEIPWYVWLLLLALPLLVKHV